MRSRVETTTAWRRRTPLLLGYNVAPPESGSGYRETLATVLRNVQQTAVVAPAARVSVARNRPWDSGGDGSRVLATAAAAPQTCCFTSRVVSWEFFINCKNYFCQYKISNASGSMCCWSGCRGAFGPFISYRAVSLHYNTYSFTLLLLLLTSQLPRFDFILLYVVGRVVSERVTTGQQKNCSSSFTSLARSG